MSDRPGGPGWWQAFDSKWYPPGQHPDFEQLSSQAADGPSGTVAVATVSPPGGVVAIEQSGRAGVDFPPGEAAVSAPDLDPGTQQSAAMIGRMRFPLRNYDGGLPVHPVPERAGFLVVTDEMRFELRFSGKSQVWQFLLGRYPLSFTRTGPRSCRVLVRDNREPSIVGAFDLPETPYEDLAGALDTLGVPIRCMSAVAEYSPWLPSHDARAS